MQIRLLCKLCGVEDTYNLAELVLDEATAAICHHCAMPINLPTETVELGEKLKRDTIPEPVFEEGETVVLDNAEHPWHNEIALICGRKHRFYRLEVNGARLWVPWEWVKNYESSDTN